MRKGIILFLVSILFLSSCGVPNYRDYSDYISVSRVSSVSGSDIEYDAGFRVELNRSGLSNMQEGSPSVLLMYSIAPGTGSLTTSFNRYIRNYNNYYNGSPATFSASGRLNNVESTAEGNPIYLYAFRGDNGQPLSTPLEYTFGSLNQYRYYYFMIRASERDGSNNFHFIMDVYGANSLSENPVHLTEDGNPDEDNDTPTSIDLYRYSNTQFTATTDGHSSNDDYSYYYVREEDDSSEYVINIALAVNVVSTEYNNIYWYQLVFDDVDPLRLTVDR